MLPITLAKGVVNMLNDQSISPAAELDYAPTLERVDIEDTRIVVAPGNTTSNILMEFDVHTASGKIQNARPLDSEIWENWTVVNTTYEKGMLLQLRQGKTAVMTLKYPVINIINK